MGLLFHSSIPLSSSIIINSSSHPFIIVICSAQCALLAVLSGVGLCHQRFFPQSLSPRLITLTELICREMLRPERLAIGQLHLVLQHQAFALRERRGQRGEERQEAGVMKNASRFCDLYKMHIKALCCTGQFCRWEWKREVTTVLLRCIFKQHS